MPGGEPDRIGDRRGRSRHQPLPGHRQHISRRSIQRGAAEPGLHHAGGRRPLRPRRRRDRAAAFVDRESAQVTATTRSHRCSTASRCGSARSRRGSTDRTSRSTRPTAPRVGRSRRRPGGGAGAAVASPFQVGACDRLAFNPKLALSLKGGMKRRGHPALKAVLNAAPGRRQPLPRIGRATELGAARQLAHQNDLHPGPVRRRPVPGRIHIWLRAGDDSAGRRAPRRAGLPAQLLQQAARPGRRPARPDRRRRRRAHRLDQGRRHPHDLRKHPGHPGLQLRPRTAGRAKGLLENSKNLCAKTYKATALFNAQNGLTSKQKPALTGACGKHSHGAKKRKHRAGKHGRSRR